MTRLRLLLGAVALLAVTGCSRELVVLLPDDSGHVGRLTVSSEDGDVVLERAYTGADPDGAAVRELDDAEVQQRFGAALAATPPAPQSFTLYFHDDSTELLPRSRPEFERLLAALSAREAPEVQITGHTDRIGTVEYNDRLSALRAAVIRAALLEQGLTADSVLAVGRGERELLVQTPDETREPRNRRVEITVR